MEPPVLLLDEPLPQPGHAVARRSTRRTDPAAADVGRHLGLRHPRSVRGAGDVVIGCDHERRQRRTTGRPGRAL